MGRRRGLTLGKFAPLHRGHQWLIDTALAEMDDVIVIIYDAPDITTIPLTIRADWLRHLYPHLTVIEAWDGPTEVGDTPEIKRKHEAYLLETLKLAGITAFYSSEFYGEHISKALGARNRQVDPPRTQVPISGSAIRAHPFRYKRYVHPYVYKDLITNVVFLGAPSTGKTTIARRLAEAFQTAWMPEYGREYWERHQNNRRLTPAQLVEIAIGHLEREDQKIQEADTYLFTDTNAITTYMFGQSYHGDVAPRLRELAMQAALRYDLIFLCDTDIPYDNTWDRSGDIQRQTFQKQIIADLQIRKLPYYRLSGTLPQRVATVRRILQKHRKYENLLAPYQNF